MNAHAFGSHPTIRAAVRAAESLCVLPAVPTQDWCDRAAKVLSTLRPSSIALVMFAKVNDNGTVARVESVGVAGCTLAEVSTTFGRVQSVSSIVPLGATHPALGSVRSAAHICADLGWPGAILSAGGVSEAANGAADRAAVAPGSALHARWSEAGVSDVVVGAAPLSGAEAGCHVVVEIGLTGSAPAGAGGEEMGLLAAVLPLLACRANVAFGGGPFTESACLTHREEVVLDHIVNGKSVRKIAGELGRSHHTVHDHVKSLHRKLNAKSRGALVARALGHVSAARAPSAPAVTTVVTSPLNNGGAMRAH